MVHFADGKAQSQRLLQRGKSSAASQDSTPALQRQCLHKITFLN